MGQLKWLLLACFVCTSTLRGERPTIYNSFALRATPGQIAPASHNGGWELVYELHIVNCSKTDLTLRRLEVLEMQSGRLRETLDRVALANAIGRMDRHGNDALTRIPPGVEVIAYMTVEWPKPTARSIALKHRLTYSTESNVPSNSRVEGGEFLIGNDAPVVLGPPLGGGDWTPIYSDIWKLGHRRVIYTTDGVEHIPGRFAIDWIKVAPDGSHAKGDDTIPANWYGYGAEVLAVADATVSVVMDDIPDPRKVDPQKVVGLQDASGDFVVLDLGDGKYAFYEHLKSRSIRVRTGDRVRRGQVIAQLGYTGQSTGPHLHFHVADASMPLNAEGIPYVFQAFKTIGVFSSAQQFGESKPWMPTRAEEHRLEIPAAFSIVDFPLAPVQ